MDVLASVVAGAICGRFRSLNSIYPVLNGAIDGIRLCGCAEGLPNALEGFLGACGHTQVRAGIELNRHSQSHTGPPFSGAGLR